MVTYEKSNEGTEGFPGGSVSAYAKFQFTGLFSDEKPVERMDAVRIRNGSSFFEMDTGAAFLYDEENKSWLEQ